MTKVINYDGLTYYTGKIKVVTNGLQSQINDLKARGRFLSIWLSNQGKPQTEPSGFEQGEIYTYSAGDYYLISSVATSGGTNYRPDGTTYIVGSISTVIETENIDESDVYYFDGAQWILWINTQKTVAFASIAGQPYDNSNLASALNSKANESDLTSHTSNTSNPHSVTKSQVGLGNVDNTSDLNKPVSTATQTALDGKQATLTAGNNISISNNTISATDTIYTAGVGININNNVISTNAVINQNDITQGLKDWCGTDNDYANISTKDADTLYFTFKQVGQILAEFTGYPLEITYAIAVALVGYKIYGNSSQTGTPTPSTPIEVTSVGDKTENLFNKVTMGTRIYAWIGSNGILAPASDSYSIEFACEGNTTYTLAIPQDVYSNLFRCGSSSSRYTGAELTLSNVVRNNPYAPITITTGANHKYIYIQFGTSTSATVLNNLVIVEGSTAPTSYIPYGYKVPINVNGTTQQTIYLTKPLAKVGTYADYIDYENQQVVRNVGVTTLSAGTHTLSDAVSNGTYLCTQQASGTLSGQSITLDIGVTNATVYYPLATPTTESVTLPEITMAEGTNTITTGISLVPSNAYAKAYVSQE